MPEDLLERIETAKEKHEEDPEEQLYTETDVANEIVAMQQSNNGLAFTADDIIVEFVKVHHGKGDQNPVNSVYFFKKEGGTAKTIDTDTKLHATLPRSFIDRCIRVFSKKSDYNRIVNAAFAEWSSEQKGAVCYAHTSCERRHSIMMSAFVPIALSLTPIASLSLRFQFILTCAIDSDGDAAYPPPKVLALPIAQ